MQAGEDGHSPSQCAWGRFTWVGLDECTHWSIHSMGVGSRRQESIMAVSLGLGGRQLQAGGPALIFPIKGQVPTSL